ncbi:MAG: Crp/Fnr family transcriptional regulator, partial [Calditrichaeota bacterium]|nr:Crp/Fnr family transcriptional regulator [Calditrichota bacterium]
MEIQALRVFPLFYDISEEELEIVREVAVERKFRKNNLIIFEDDVGNNLFIIKRGRVKIS